MSEEVQPISEHPRWEAFQRSFKQSNYITDFWNWFLTLLSKSAELVLFGSILYSSYQLIPGVPSVPAAIDAFLFLVQQAALDIGGMGLLKLAKRAGLPKESFPMRVGVTLVVLMILNVILATLKHALPMVPAVVFVIVETILLVARAIMAVLFGHAIHALREEYGDSTITIKDASELRANIEELTNELANVRQQLHRMQANSEHRVTEQLHRMQANSEQQRANMEHRLTDTEHRLTEQVQACLQERLAPVTEQMQVYAEVQALGEEVDQLKTIGERHPAPKRIERTPKRTEQQETPPNIRPFGKANTAMREDRTANNEPNGFEKGTFVRQCLTDNPNVHNADIKRQAAELGQEISASYISETRKAFFEEQTAQEDIA